MEMNLECHLKWFCTTSNIEGLGKKKTQKFTGYIAESTYPKPLILSLCHNCFLQSYVLMALVRRQLTSCIPTCLIESKE